MNIVYVIDEGPRVYIERINIVGNFRTEDQVIRRQFRLAEGDAYNRLLVEAARKRLRALGFFKSVDIETAPGSAPDRVILTVNVVEQPTGEFSFGAGYSTSEGVIGDISITERNLMGKGQYVRLGFSGSLERAQVDFSFTEPNFLDRNLAAGFDLFYKTVDLQNVASFSQRTAGGNLRLGFPIADNTQMGLRYRFEREEIFDAKSNASLAVRQAADEGAVNVSSVGYTVAFDTRNVPQSPTSWRLRLLLSGSGGRRRRRELHPVGGRRTRLLSHHQQDHPCRPRPGRGHRGLGRRRPSFDRPVLQGRRDNSRLQAGRLRSARRVRKPDYGKSRGQLPAGLPRRQALLGDHGGSPLPVSFHPR